MPTKSLLFFVGVFRRSGPRVSGGDVLDLAGRNLFLRNLAGLAGAGSDQRRRSACELAGATRCHQNITIVAVKSFFQLHDSLPLYLGGRGIVKGSKNVPDLGFHSRL